MVCLFFWWCGGVGGEVKIPLYFFIVGPNEITTSCASRVISRNCLIFKSAKFPKLPKKGGKRLFVPKPSKVPKAPVQAPKDYPACQVVQFTFRV